MNLGQYNLSKETILRLLNDIVDGKITRSNLSRNPSNSFSREVVRFVSDYLKVKPENLSHSDIRVIS
jgi:hypothetical protein